LDDAFTGGGDAFIDFAIGVHALTDDNALGLDGADRFGSRRITKGHSQAFVLGLRAIDIQGAFALGV